jgi:hypothetical protein
MTCLTLVHELGREQLKTTKELLDTPLARRRLGLPSSLAAWKRLLVEAELH